MEQDSRRNAPRFVHEEEPGDGTVRTDKWVGAFERVLGDKGEALASDRSMRSKSLARTIKVTEETEADEPRQGNFSEAGSSPSGESSMSYLSSRPHVALSGDSTGANETALRPSMSSTSISSMASSSASIRPALNVSSGQHPNRGSTIPRTLTDRPLSDDGDSNLSLSASPGYLSIISVSQPSIIMDNVYMNHAPGLHRLIFRNTLEQKRALVRIESDIAKALTFMRRKRTSSVNALDSICWPSNSAAWAHADGFAPSMLRDLRHMGANLEPSDSFIIEPGGTVDLFVVLRPSMAVPKDRDNHNRGSRVGHDLSGSSSESLALPMLTTKRLSGTTNSSPEPSSSSSSGTGYVVSREPTPREYSLFHIHGKVTVRSWALANVSVDPTVSEDTSEAETSTSTTSAGSSRPASYYESNTSSIASSSTPGTDVMDDPPQTILLPFFASCCRAQLGVTSQRSSLKASNAPKDQGDAEEQLAQHPRTQGLFVCDFGDILVDHNEDRIFSLHNLSDIECFWQARVEDADNMLHTPPIQIISKASDQPIPMVGWTDERQSEYCPLTLAPRSTLQMSINLLPREPCRDYEQIITMSNLHEPSNSIRIIIRANILGSAKDDALSVLSGDTLDFGDCCGGHWTRQLLILKNPGDVVLDVAFSIQKGVEATFQLAELAPQPDDVPEADHSHELGSMHSARASSDALVPSTIEAHATSSGAPTDSTGSSIIGSLLSERLEQQDRADSERQGSTDGVSISAADFARTPTTHAQADEAAEPPPLKLHEMVCPPLGLQIDQADAVGEDVDASSNASQAGSQAGSPQQLSKSLASLSSTQHRPSLMDHIRNEGYLTDARSDGSGQTSSMASGPISDSGRSRMLRNVPSSGLISRAGSSLEPRSVYQSGEDSERADDAASVKSDATALSADSRLGPFAAGSTSHASSSASRGVAQYLGLRELRSVESAQSNQLEELSLRPGAEYRVIVSCRPPRGSLDEDYTAGRLTETKFRISLDYARSRTGGTRTRGGRVRKTILCYTRTCTSFISVSPKLVDFGEANVGTRKSANIVVKNHSELTARVDLRFDSKVLSMYRDEVAIPPLQTVELKVDFFPRRVNEAYRKQITVANLLNRHDDKIFEVRSKNVDQQRVSFHSLFYRILTPTGSNFIDFGDVNINSTRIRTFSIENCTTSKLTLELSAAHAEDLTLYIRAPSSTPLASHESDGSSVPSGARTPNRYADFESSESSATKSAAKEVEGAKAKGSKMTGKGVDLKERFLETISVDSPASIRQENAVWRLAQRQSHVKKKAGDDNVSGQPREGGTVKPKVPINLVAALKKGGKGRLTMLYGKSMTFKDRKLLSDFEYLDLCSGPPVDSKRIFAKSKRYQALEVLETGRRSKSSNLGKNLRSALDSADTPVPSDGKSAKKPRSALRQLAVEPETPKKSATRSVASSPSVVAIKKESIAADRASSSGELKSPALTGKRQALLALSDPTDVSKLSVNELISAVEAQTSSLNTFFLGNPAAEERHVRTEVNLQREFQSAIAMGRLVRVSMLSIHPQSEQQVIAVYSPNSSTRPHVQGNARKQDSRIFLRLVDYDVDIVRASPDFASMVNLHRDELPVRDLMVRSTVCRSLLELGQPHINFGHVDKGDTKTRKILIQNRSEWALRYCIRKSGSIASGDIKLSSGRYGVVPGYGKREVEFIFSPSLSGQFQERLIVENVGDRDNNQTVVLKANVRKVSNFAVDPPVIDFGPEKPGKLSSAESFIVSNTTSKSRTFNVVVDPHSLRLQRAIVDLVLTNASTGDVRGGLTKAEEEEVEHISQKLKIATRKGHEDKIRKYEKRMEELGVKPPSQDVAQASDGAEKVDGGAASPALDQGDKNADSVAEATSENPASRLKRISSSVTFGLAPNQSKRFLLRVRAHPVQTVLGPHASGNVTAAAAEDFSVPIAVHEAKNKDETKIVTVRAKLELDDQGATLQEDSESAPPDSVTFTSLSAS